MFTEDTVKQLAAWGEAVRRGGLQLRPQEPYAVWGCYRNADGDDIHSLPVSALINRVPTDDMPAVSDELLACHHCRAVLRQLLAELADHAADEALTAALVRTLEVLSSTHVPD
jgi:hypothetical protein